MSNDKLDSKAAKELLLKEQQDKIKACGKEIQIVLDKYDMQLQAQAVVQANQVGIVPKG